MMYETQRLKAGEKSMITLFRVTVTYPNGKTEEIDDTFRTLDAAISYGKALLGQIPSNAGYKGKSQTIFGEKKTVKSYFVIHKCEGRAREQVYDSREA